MDMMWLTITLTGVVIFALVAEAMQFRRRARHWIIAKVQAWMMRRMMKAVNKSLDAALAGTNMAKDMALYPVDRITAAAKKGASYLDTPKRTKTCADAPKWMKTCADAQKIVSEEQARKLHEMHIAAMVAGCKIPQSPQVTTEQAKNVREALQFQADAAVAAHEQAIRHAHRVISKALTKEAAGQTLTDAEVAEMHAATSSAGCILPPLSSIIGDPMPNPDSYDPRAVSIPLPRPGNRGHGNNGYRDHDQSLNDVAKYREQDSQIATLAAQLQSMGTEAWTLTETPVAAQMVNAETCPVVRMSMHFNGVSQFPAIVGTQALTAAAGKDMWFVNVGRQVVAVNTHKEAAALMQAINDNFVAYVAERRAKFLQDLNDFALGLSEQPASAGWTLAVKCSGSTVYCADIQDQAKVQADLNQAYMALIAPYRSIVLGELAAVTKTGTKATLDHTVP